MPYNLDFYFICRQSGIWLEAQIIIFICETFLSHNTSFEVKKQERKIIYSALSTMHQKYIQTKLIIVTVQTRYNKIKLRKIHKLN